MCGVAGFLFAGFLFSASTGSTAGLMSYDISNKIDVVDLGMSFDRISIQGPLTSSLLHVFQVFRSSAD